MSMSMSISETSNVLLFIPNLIGYVRLVSLLFCWLWLDQPVIFVCLYSFQCLLDGVDGWCARRFHQTSKFGAWFDVLIDNVGRALLWNCVSSLGFFVSSVEWTTFVALNSIGSEWKARLASTEDVIVKNLMKNGFRTVFGFVCVVLGLHAFPLLLYISQNDLSPPAMASIFHLLIVVSGLGRLFSFYSEIFVIRLFIQENLLK